MTLRSYLELGLVALAGAAGWGYVHQRDARLRAEGRLEVVSAFADSTAKAAGVAVDASARRAAHADSVVSVEEEARAAAERRATAAAVRIPAARDSVIVAAGPDSAAVRAKLDQLEAIHVEREDALADQIRSDTIIIAQLRAVDVTRVAAIASLESALAASQAKADAALAARPGFIQRNLPKILVPVTAVATWIVRGLIKG